MYLFLFYPLIGAVAGFLSGLLGIGGGKVIVPSLALIFDKTHLFPTGYMQMAAATSLAVIAVTMSISARAYHRHGDVLWPVWKKIMPAAFLGTLTGAFLAPYLPAHTLIMIFGLFLMSISIRGFWKAKAISTPKDIASRSFLLASIGGVTGFLSALIGIGGSAFIISFLLIYDVPVRKAMGTAAACSCLITLSGAIIYAIKSPHLVDIPYHIGYLYYPAFFGVILGSTIFVRLGVKLARKMDTVLLKKIFSTLLFCVAVKILVF